MLDKLMLGLEVAVIGLVAVFAILFFLIICINLLSTAIKKFGWGEKKSSQKQPEPQEVTEVVESEQTDNGSLIAAISAAVYALLASEDAVSGSHPEFAIRKIREIKRR